MNTLKERIAERRAARSTFATTLLIRYNNLIEEDPEYIADVLRVHGEPDENYHRYMAAVHLLTSNFYWRNIVQFLILSDAITYGAVNLNSVPLASVESIGWSVVEAVILTPDFDDLRFDNNILTYIKKRVEYERECPVTLRPFIGPEYVEKYENAITNNWIVDRMHTLVNDIKAEFEKRGERMNISSLSDLEMRLSIFTDHQNSAPSTH